MKVLFVCLGNICRSPLAEGIFNHKIREKGLENEFSADSCGTADYHIGDPPDPRTVRNARKNGIELRHACRQFSAHDFTNFDLIIPMDHNNKAQILSFETAAGSSNKVRMMREFDTKDKGAAVPDPYYGGEKQFQEVFDILNRSIDGLLDDLTGATT